MSARETARREQCSLGWLGLYVFGMQARDFPKGFGSLEIQGRVFQCTARSPAQMRSPEPSRVPTPLRPARGSIVTLDAARERGAGRRAEGTGATDTNKLRMSARSPPWVGAVGTSGHGVPGRALGRAPRRRLHNGWPRPGHLAPRAAGLGRGRGSDGAGRAREGPTRPTARPGSGQRHGGERAARALALDSQKMGGGRGRKVASKLCGALRYT